jgi:hypothetical protein
VFVVLIARSAPNRASASVRATFFFVAMTIAYYGTAALVFGRTAKVFLTFWLVASVSGAPFAAAVTHGSGHEDWSDSLAGAFPIGLLAAEALRLVFKTGAPDWFALLFDVGAAGLLIAVWTRDERIRYQFAVFLIGTTCAGFALARIVGLGFHLLKA